MLHNDQVKLSSGEKRTKQHYEDFPFMEGGANRISWWKNYMAEFLADEHVQGKSILDLGSSKGEISNGLIQRGANMTCFDISLPSLRRCGEINPQAIRVQGSALNLPFVDNCFDHTISVGVLHHTPDAYKGFTEAVRVTAPGGYLVIFLYTNYSIYQLLYYLFYPIRKILPLAKVPNFSLSAIQLIMLAHQGSKIPTDQLRNLLGDKLWTPNVSFHSVKEMEAWAAPLGVKVLKSDTYFLNSAFVVLLQKPGKSEHEPNRPIEMICPSCKKIPLLRQTNGFVCATCQFQYHTEQGITQTFLSA